MTGIVAQILNGVVKVWDVVETDIESAVAKVKAALPASAQGNLSQVETDVKQAASDALSTVASTAVAYAPDLSKVIETGADNALGILLGGYAVPLVPLLNDGIDKIVATGVATLQSWALAAKASAAVPAKVPTPAPAPASPPAPTLGS